jgi:hypothetical protein
MFLKHIFRFSVTTPDIPTRTRGRRAMSKLKTTPKSIKTKSGSRQGMIGQDEFDHVGQC